MAKAPVMGRVKTRLAADIGWGPATAFYRASLAALCRTVGHDPRWQTTIAIAPDSAVGLPIWPAGLGRIPQGPGDLGVRMQRVMNTMPPGPVVIVGCDIPGLGPAHVAAAFDRLGAAEAVFGPAEDGGYYLVGLKRVPRIPDAFRDVRWSGPQALADTLANLTGARIAFLERLADVDDGADWRRLHAGA